MPLLFPMKRKKISFMFSYGLVAYTCFKSKLLSFLETNLSVTSLGKSFFIAMLLIFLSSEDLDLSHPKELESCI